MCLNSKEHIANNIEIEMEMEICDITNTTQMKRPLENRAMIQTI